MRAAVGGDVGLVRLAGEGILFLGDPRRRWQAGRAVYSLLALGLVRSPGTDGSA